MRCLRMPNKYKVNQKVDKEAAEEIYSWKRERIYTHTLPLWDLWNGLFKSLMTALTVPSPRLTCLSNKPHHVTSMGLILPSEKFWASTELEKESISLYAVSVQATAGPESRALICKGESSSLQKPPQWHGSPTKVTAGICSKEKNMVQGKKTPILLFTV